MKVKSELIDAQLEVRDTDHSTHSANKKGLVWFSKGADKIKMFCNSTIESLASESWSRALLDNRLDQNGILADVNHSSIPAQSDAGSDTAGDYPQATLSNLITFTSTGKPVRVLFSNKLAPDNIAVNPGIWIYNKTYDSGKIYSLRVHLINEADGSVVGERYLSPHLFRSDSGAISNDRNIFPYGFDFVLDSLPASEITLGLKLYYITTTRLTDTREFRFSDLNIKAIRI